MMKATMMVALAATALALDSAALGKGTLDGRSFAVASGEAGKSATVELERLVFERGTFRSTGCDRYGFVAAAYVVKAAGGATTWEADTASANEGRIHWKGTVTGDRVEGTYVWTKAGQAPIAYWFASK